MSDEIIKRDQNHATVGAGISNDSDQEILMLRVDPVTKYLLVDRTEAASTAENATQIAKRDQNHRTVCMAWNEEAGEVQEILTDENGNLLVDMLII